MNNPNDKSVMLKEIAIFDYVAGNQSASAKRNFEKILEQDSELREAVEVERQLRASMRQAGKLKPVSMSNFDALLTNIEEQEANSETQDIESPVASNVTSIFARPTFLKPNLSRYYAMAASVAVIAIVFGGFYQTQSAPEFETLSNTIASGQVDFSKLTQQARLAKMTLVENLPEQEIQELLSSYNLTSFESGGDTNSRYVISESAISTIELDRWRDDARVLEVELFTTSDEG